MGRRPRDRAPELPRHVPALLRARVQAKQGRKYISAPPHPATGRKDLFQIISNDPNGKGEEEQTGRRHCRVPGAAEPGKEGASLLYWVG